MLIKNHDNENESDYYPHTLIMLNVNVRTVDNTYYLRFLDNKGQISTVTVVAISEQQDAMKYNLESRYFTESTVSAYPDVGTGETKCYTNRASSSRSTSGGAVVCSSSALLLNISYGRNNIKL